MLDQFKNLPERGIIIIQPGDDPAMQIAHVIAIEMNFEPIMIIGHDRTRDLTHILAIHHNSHHHPIFHIGSSEEIGIQEAGISDVLHKLVDLQIKDTQDLILTLQAEQEDLSPIQDCLGVDQKKEWGINRKNYSNHNTSKSRQSYRSHTQKKR